MTAIYKVLNDIDQRLGKSAQQFLEALSKHQIAQSGALNTARVSLVKKHSEMTQSLRHALGYQIAEKTFYQMSVEEIEQAQVVMALHSVRVKAFFTQQMGLLLAGIAHLSGDANNTQSNIARGTVITGLVKMMDAELKAMQDLHKALEDERKRKYPKPPRTESPLLIHSTAYTPYSENSSLNGLLNLANALFGGPSNGDALSWYQWNQGFNAGYADANSPWCNFLSSDYSNGYQQGQLDHALFDQVFPYIGHELKEGFQAAFRLSNDAANQIGTRIADGFHHLFSALDSSLQGLTHAASKGCCELGHACSGCGHDFCMATHAAHAVANDCGSCLGQGCGDCLSAVGSVARGSCDLLGAILRGFGDCFSGMGRIDADCCKAVGSIFGLAAGGAGTLTGASPSNGDPNDNIEHDVSNAAADSAQKQDFLKGYGEAAWIGIMAVLSLILVRNTVQSIRHIHKEGFHRDKSRLGWMLGTAAISGAVGLLLHVPYHDEVIGGPKTGIGTALALGVMAYYFTAMTDKRHGAKAYGSTHPERDFLASDLLASMNPPQRMLAAELMNSLQTALDLVKQEDMAGCSRAWLKAKLWAYHSPLHDALRAIQTQLRHGNFNGASAAIAQIDDTLTSSYDAKLKAEIAKMKSVAEQLAEAYVEAHHAQACCC